MKRKLIFWLMFVAVFLGVNEWDQHENNQKLQEMSRKTFPPIDPTKGEPLFYSVQEDRWIYPTQSPAKAQDCPPRAPNLHKQLQEEWPLYKRKTYWGQEWDEETKRDIIWSDEGDDEEVIPDK